MFLFLFLFFLLIYLRDKVIKREGERAWVGAGRGRGRSRLPTEQGARCRTQSQDPEIMPPAEGSHSTNWATQAPKLSSPYLSTLSWLHLIIVPSISFIALITIWNYLFHLCIICLTPLECKCPRTGTLHLFFTARSPMPKKWYLVQSWHSLNI